MRHDSKAHRVLTHNRRWGCARQKHLRQSWCTSYRYCSRFRLDTCKAGKRSESSFRVHSENRVEPRRLGWRAEPSSGDAEALCCVLDSIPRDENKVWSVSSMEKKEQRSWGEWVFELFFRRASALRFSAHRCCMGGGRRSWCTPPAPNPRVLFIFLARFIQLV